MPKAGVHPPTMLAGAGGVLRRENKLYEGNVMKHALIILGVFWSFIAFSATEASAVVCARGVYRAGCAGPNGAVGVRRGVYGPAVGVRRGVYAPRGAVVVRRR